MPYDKPLFMRPPTETAFALITLVLSVPYLLGETCHYIAYVGFGNHFLGYLCDLITIALMWLGSITSLKNRGISAAGWLAGAWGFATCLAYRSFMWRFEAFQDGQTPDFEPTNTIWVVGGLMVISFIAFAYALYLARPQKAS